jgi:hypothetical protein
LLFAAGVLFAGGADGFEHVSGARINPLRYNLPTGLEERLETAGMILAIWSLLDLIRRQIDRQDRLPRFRRL